MMQSTAEAVHELYPSGSCVVWQDGSIVCDDPKLIINMDAVNTLAATKEGARIKVTLKTISSRECLRRICAIINPLDGQPLSTRPEPDQMRTDALVGWANAKDYTTLSTASQPVIDAIKAAITERFRLLGCHSTNKNAIDAGTITTEAQVLDPAKW